MDAGDLPRLAGAGRRPAPGGDGTVAPGLPQGGWHPTFGLGISSYLCGFCPPPPLSIATPHFYLSFLGGDSGLLERNFRSLHLPPPRATIAVSPSLHTCGIIFWVQLGPSPQGLAKFGSHGTHLGGNQPLDWIFPPVSLIFKP